MSGDAECCLDELRAILSRYERLAVALSGGLDSALLLKVAHDVLGDNVLALTACGDIYASWEIARARRLAESIGAAHQVLDVHPLAIPGFCENPPERCYLCKKALLGRLVEHARSLGFDSVADGGNVDDARDYRPGRRAVRELGVASPLAEAGMGKAVIRELSRRFGLETAEAPSQACLASRFPYGEPITREKLGQVERGELALREMGFEMMRVRHHGKTARIELATEDIVKAVEPDCRRQIVHQLKDAGFRWVALDLQGYRTGSLNEDLPPELGGGRH